MKNSILYYLAGIIWPTTYLALFVGLMMQEWLPFLLAVHFAGQGMMVYATIRPNCGWFGPVVRSFQTDRKEIWLTIDDGPNPETTPAILKLLKGYNARATFFVVGKNVRQHPDLARLIVAHGHTLGNHSESHPSAHFWSLLKGSVAREVDKCNAVVQKAAGESPAFFRAPVGMANPFVHRVVRERKMLLVGWTSRGFDSARKNAQRIVNAIISDIKPGAIVLLHECSVLKGDPECATVNGRVSAFELILARLNSEGYACTVPEHQQLRF